jgi:hypothetical protein
LALSEISLAVCSDSKLNCEGLISKPKH